MSIYSKMKSYSSKKAKSSIPSFAGKISDRLIMFDESLQNEIDKASKKDSEQTINPKRWNALLTEISQFIPPEYIKQAQNIARRHGLKMGDDLSLDTSSLEAPKAAKFLQSLKTKLSLASFSVKSEAEANEIKIIIEAPEPTEVEIEPKKKAEVEVKGEAEEKEAESALPVNSSKGCPDCKVPLDSEGFCPKCKKEFVEPYSKDKSIELDSAIPSSIYRKLASFVK